MLRRVIFQARQGDSVKLGHITYDLMRYCSYEYEEHYLDEETHKRMIKTYIRTWFTKNEIIDISIVSLDDFWMADLDLVYDYVISEPDGTYYVFNGNECVNAKAPCRLPAGSPQGSNEQSRGEQRAKRMSYLTNIMVKKLMIWL